jgi:hypothetical protein
MARRLGDPSDDRRRRLLSTLRTRDARLRVLPSVLDRKAAPDRAALQVTIGEWRLVDATIELHDASTRTPAHRLRIEHVDATAGPLALPALGRVAEIELSGVLKGIRHDGRLHVAGTVTGATRRAHQGAVRRLRSARAAAIVVRWHRCPGGCKARQLLSARSFTAKKGRRRLSRAGALCQLSPEVVADVALCRDCSLSFARSLPLRLFSQSVFRRFRMRKVVALPLANCIAVSLLAFAFSATSAEQAANAVIGQKLDSGLGQLPHYSKWTDPSGKSPMQVHVLGEKLDSGLGELPRFATSPPVQVGGLVIAGN